MNRFIALALLAFAVTGCTRQPATRAKITGFSATPSFLPTGIAGKLCYGVENATKLDLNPPVEALLPASEYCIDIAPKQTTTYTLTAYGKDGDRDKKSLEVKVGWPPPRLSDLAASSNEIPSGALVRVCFHLENARSVKAKPGKLDLKSNCVIDHPHRTTTYKITALGRDRDEDTGTVTVKVDR